jgi:hypothetical protein
MYVRTYVRIYVCSGVEEEEEEEESLSRNASDVLEFPHPLPARFLRTRFRRGVPVSSELFGVQSWYMLMLCSERERERERESFYSPYSFRGISDSLLMHEI